MSDLDLNLDNYSLMELLNLFHLNKTFDEKDLKKAKIMALKTHPDKSGLEEKIFIFFKKAYDRIERIYNFRARSKSKRYNESYTKMVGDVTNVGERELLKKVHGKSVKEFNSWFNEMYESHVKMKDLENYKTKKKSKSEQFLDWIADYTLAPKGLVLKLFLINHKILDHKIENDKNIDFKLLLDKCIS